jgi:hypothetical protein
MLKAPLGSVGPAELAHSMVRPSGASCKMEADWKLQGADRTMEPAAIRSPWLPAMQYWAWRAGGFILLNVLDDPAWLALMFC